jgi:hypothetical protein
MRFLLIFSFLGVCLAGCSAQPPTFTANDYVPPFEGQFGYGVNPGVYPPHYMDRQLADLAYAHGATTMRPALPENFLDYWGYDIRVAEFQHYQQIGMRDLVVFIGFPGPTHRDSAYYCPGVLSEMFRHMYLPIWDNGENGTPVNDLNPYALYCWRMATTYGPYIKYYEVWNEPDVDTGNGWAPPGIVGNWWENTPTPCETKLKAPAYFYIRMLRITYEVIKSVQPDAYVCVGGIGWPSYLDVICRNTDNPFDGSVTANYPLRGGAYFDVLSYHTYPHIDNSLREWDNSINGFRNFRHSDAAIDGVWRLKSKFQTVLTKYGYGTQHPEKQWMITELNVPRRQFGDYLGSDEAQVNFTIKALVTAQIEGVRQLHFYSLADEVPESAGGNEFAYMGLFKNLADVPLGQAVANAQAHAFHTTAQQLAQAEYHPQQTARLQLPADVRGGAFERPDGSFVYVLWAVTARDRDETASATYTFPEALQLDVLDEKPWHHSQSGVALLANAQQVLLTGSPVFLTATSVSPGSFPKEPTVQPNPLRAGRGVLSFWLFENAPVSVEVFDNQGRMLQKLLADQPLVEGPQQLELDWSTWPRGLYVIRVITPESNLAVRVVRP